MPFSMSAIRFLCAYGEGVALIRVSIVFGRSGNLDATFASQNSTNSQIRRGGDESDCLVQSTTYPLFKKGGFIFPSTPGNLQRPAETVTLA